MSTQMRDPPNEWRGGWFVVPIAIKFKYDDGGRQQAGFKGSAGDCVCRAIAIATGKPYLEVYQELNELGAKERNTKRRRTRKGEHVRSHARTGVFTPTIRKYLLSLSWTWTPTMTIGSGCKVHLATDELPSGRLIVSVSKHTTTVIDGVLHDTHDCSRGGMRCVYGYFKKI